MNILSIDTSTKNFSLAVSKDGKVLRYRNIQPDKLLESSIIPAIDSILKLAKVRFDELDGFAVGLGPGSFTSLRVGLSTIKAFVLATGKPVVGVCSLDVIAANVLGIKCDEICVIMDARRKLLYACLYEEKNGALKRKTEPMLVTLDDLLDKVHGRTLFVGDALGLLKDVIREKYREADPKGSKCVPIFASQALGVPQAKKLFVLAFGRFCNKEYDESVVLSPVYLYAQDCQVQNPLSGK